MQFNSIFDSFIFFQYRHDLLEKWIANCSECEVPCTTDFKLAITLSDKIQIRCWTLCELPLDDYAVENAIIVKNAHRFPLMIDPQGE